MQDHKYFYKIIILFTRRSVYQSARRSIPLPFDNIFVSIRPVFRHCTKIAGPSPPRGREGVRRMTERRVRRGNFSDFFRCARKWERNAVPDTGFPGFSMPPGKKGVSDAGRRNDAGVSPVRIIGDPDGNVKFVLGRLEKQPETGRMAKAKAA